MNSPVLFLLLFFIPLNAGAYIPDAASSMPTAQLAAGDILIASQVIKNGFFSKSVIVLTRHGQRGSVGLLVNRPSSLQINTVAPDLIENRRATCLYVGGPVEPSVISVLVNTDKAMQGMTKVMTDTYYGTRMSIDTINTYLASDTDAVRCYSGYAGWGSGQLEAEINHGAWYVLTGTPAILFESNTDTLWEQLMRKVQAKQ